jgi:hypothetical protein
MKQLRGLTYNGYHLTVMFDEQSRRYTGDVVDRQLARLEADSLPDLRREFHSVIDALVSEEVREVPNLLDSRNAGVVIPLGGSLTPSLGTPSVDEFGLEPDEADDGHEHLRKQEWED